MVIDPRPRCIFVGPRPARNEPYVRYDVCDQAWATWNDFLIQRVGPNPRQGKPIAMVRSQPLSNVMESPHMARLPMQRRSAIMEACGRACGEIDVQDNCYAYRTFIERHPYRREEIENFIGLPLTLRRVQQQVEAVVRSRSSWTIQQQTHRIANPVRAPVETRSLPADRASLLDADPMREGIVVERSSRDSDRPRLRSVILQRRLQRNPGIS